MRIGLIIKYMWQNGVTLSIDTTMVRWNLKVYSLFHPHYSVILLSLYSRWRRLFLNFHLKNCGSSTLSQQKTSHIFLILCTICSIYPFLCLSLSSAPSSHFIANIPAKPVVFFVFWYIFNRSGKYWLTSSLSLSFTSLFSLCEHFTV